MLAMKDTSMAGCTNSSYQMIAACGALQTLAAVNSPHVPAFAKVVAQMCEDCQKECEKFPMLRNARRVAIPARPAPENVTRWQRRASDCHCERTKRLRAPDQASAVSRPRSPDG